MPRGLLLGTNTSLEEFRFDPAQVLDEGRRPAVMVVTGPGLWLNAFKQALPKRVAYDDGTRPVGLALADDDNDWQTVDLLSRNCRSLRHCLVFLRASGAICSHGDRLLRRDDRTIRLTFMQERGAIFSSSRIAPGKWVNLVF